MATPFIGEIKMFAGNFAPVNWAFCNGQLIAISQNPALFQLIGTTYGGDGTQTFALPNLQSRLALHQGTGPGLTPRIMGEQVGAEEVTLLTVQLPIHSHPARCSTQGAVGGPSGNYWATDPSGNIAPYSDVAANNTMAPTAIAVSGGQGLPHDNMQPFLAINFIIALFGVFPSQS